MKLTTFNRAAPYPSLQTLYREISVALDTKSYVSKEAARKLDGLCKKNCVHYYELEETLKQVIIEPVRSVFNDEYSARVEIFVRNLSTAYFKWISMYSLGEVTVEQANQLFNDSQFFENLVIQNFALKQADCKPLCLPGNTTLILDDANACKVLLNNTVNKEIIDRWNRWISEKEKPSLNTIANLDQTLSLNFNKQQWLELKWSLLASRFVHHFLSSFGINLTGINHELFVNANQLNKQQLLPISMLNDVTLKEYNVHQTVTKNEAHQERMRKLLKLTNEELAKLNPELGANLSYLHAKARFLVNSGFLEEANATYKEAFNIALFRVHHPSQFKKLIAEALRVAAYQSPNPDKVFITNLKSMLILTGMEPAPARTDEPDRNRRSVIAANEIDAYREELQILFPEKFAYPNVTYPSHPKKAGLIFDKLNPLGSDIKMLKKKKVTVGLGDGVQRLSSPLIEAIKNNDLESVALMLKSGASVNALSEVNESPLLMSLELLDFQTPYAPMDRRIFDLIVTHSHSAKTLNTISRRKMRFPLNAAVDSGQQDIVKTVLSLNKDIDIDLKGGLDYMSPLYQTLCLLPLIKKPSLLEQKAFENISDESIHRLKPMFAGILPTFIEDMRKALTNNGTNDGRKGSIKSVYQKLFMENFRRHSPSPSKIRHIARILILAGANPNLEHNINGMKYTPLMLAAEFGELSLFKLMIAHNGDWRKTYVLPSQSVHNEKAIHCLHIARNFNQQAIVDYIEHNLV
ncbi:hypothetical protein AB733_15505 [Photobacterium swingsii]|uniref:Ankyrin repeat domain-containing protein n=1 Tax=Photobacterium swingsii TaxID=680026 RepID=A0A0J8VBG6_9GAMM|nr:ankyrin repeat domain-containing protein [Photobacterium swingsii]KMV29895.1 hypothetical protein AB733_15505 [Photobacterium swingsii]PSW26018.1 ankyrin repeat domain-containing protein [Photobacterium swingsii]